MREAYVDGACRVGNPGFLFLCVGSVRERRGRIHMAHVI